MAARFRKIVGSVVLAVSAAACASGAGMPVLKDGSGQPIVIGGEHNASVGPGKPGWPEPTGAQRYGR